MWSDGGWLWLLCCVTVRINQQQWQRCSLRFAGSNRSAAPENSPEAEAPRKHLSITVRTLPQLNRESMWARKLPLAASAPKRIQGILSPKGVRLWNQAARLLEHRVFLRPLPASRLFFALFNLSVPSFAPASLRRCSQPCTTSL
jgi:hypothetical protein